MMTMKRRKSSPSHRTIRSEVCELGDHLSFLDVLAQACARNARHTLTVESASVTYTILVDRGGPFNATGGGAPGSSALVHAAQLRSGRCTLTPGWPADQPMYQPGLDMTLKALLNGAVEPATLPRHRGVDSLRNAEFRDASFPTSDSPEAYVRKAEVPSDTERLIASLPRAEQPVRPAASMPLQAAPVQAAPVQAAPVQAAPVQAAPVQAAPVQAAPVQAAPVQAAPVQAAPVQRWKVVETELPVKGSDSAVAAPTIENAHGAATADTARRLATRALLWMVEVDQTTEEYSLRQAASLAGRGLVDGIGELVHPLKRDLGGRIHSVKAEWVKSGEIAAKKTRKDLAVRVQRDADPDREFRLR